MGVEGKNTASDSSAPIVGFAAVKSCASHAAAAAVALSSTPLAARPAGVGNANVACLRSVRTVSAAIEPFMGLHCCGAKRGELLICTTCVDDCTTRLLDLINFTPRQLKFSASTLIRCCLFFTTS